MLRSGTTPWGLMFLSVLCYSLVPMAVVVFGGSAVPFLFNAVYRMGGAAGGLLFLFLAGRHALLGSEFRRAAAAALLRRDFPLVMLPYFGFTAFAWSARYVDVALTAVVQELWPLFFILFTGWLMRVEARWVRPSCCSVIPVLGCFGGFVLSSLSSGLSAALSRDSLLGVSLALLAALMVSSGAYNYRWAADLRGAVSGGDAALRLGLMLAFTVGSGFSAVANLLLAGLSGELGGHPGMPLPVFLCGVMSAGLLLDAGGTLFNRTANLSAKSLSVNALAYMGPLMSLGWLVPFHGAGGARLELLLAGAAVIVCCNLLLFFRSS